MSDLPSRRDLFAAGRRSIVTTPNLRINPAVIDIPGSDVNILLGASSLMGEEVVKDLARCMEGLWVASAQGDKLARVAFDRYGITSLSANPASVDVTLARPLPGVATPGTYPAGSRVQTSGGIQFATDVDAVFGNLSTSVVVSATAMVTGLGGNVTAGTITSFADPPFDVTMTVTNVAGAAGGTTAESDDAFKARIRGFFATVRRGTLGAIEFGARQVPGVAVATATEILNIVANQGFPASFVQLVVGDKSGGSSSKMLQQVKDAMLVWRAGGIPTIVMGGQVVYQAVRWLVDFEVGTDQARAASQLRAVTVAVGQFLNPGETLRRASLIAGAHTVPGVIVNAGSLLLPVGDTETTSVEQMIRVKAQDVTFG